MQRRLAPGAALLGLAPLLLAAQTAAPAPGPTAAQPGVGEVLEGEALDPRTAHGPAWIESMAEAVERERENPSPKENQKARGDAQGYWATPALRVLRPARSGRMYVSNRWGDTRMTIEFPEAVTVEGAWFQGQGQAEVSTDGVRLLGYRGDVLVGETAWLELPEDGWRELRADLEGVTRLVVEARAVYRGAGWYGLDDLAFVRAGARGAERVVVDFEDLHANQKLLATDHAGLGWPRGSGDFSAPGRERADVEEVHPPQAPPGAGPEAATPASTGLPLLAGAGTPPALVQDFPGPSIANSAGAGWVPPDTCGAIGREHFVAAVNQNLSVYDRATGQRLVDVGLQNFFNTGGASAGDPRVAYDHHSGRWVVIATDFSTLLWLAVSTGEDATGTWFKTSIVLSQGADAARWPDYPTLGVDANGIYSASYMVGGNSISLFAIDKAPLLAATPSLGAVTAFRDLPWEGAVQPCVTHGNPGRAYCISRRTSNSLRLRYVQPPLTAPTLVQAGNVQVPNHGSPPSAPQLGSSTSIATNDWRPINAVYRNGSVYTAQTISVSGRAAVRWYEVDAQSASLVQSGTIADPEKHYYFPGIAVNQDDAVVLGFSGSDANTYVSSYVCGRTIADPPGAVSAPQLLRAGAGPYDFVGGNGTNRWGDYSLSSVDPLDDRTIWTIQEHARDGNAWGTRIGALVPPIPCLTPATYCTSLANSAGPGATIGWASEPSLSANAFELNALGLPPNKPGLFFYGPNQVSLIFGDGIRCVGGQLVRLPVVQSDALGAAAQLLDLQAPPFSGGGVGSVAVGDTRNFQLWYRDPGFGAAGFNTSDALEVTFCP
jgi:hypothetical protein